MKKTSVCLQIPISFECNEKKVQKTKKKYNLRVKIFKFEQKKSTYEVFGKKKVQKSTNQLNRLSYFLQRARDIRTMVYSFY